MMAGIDRVSVAEMSGLRGRVVGVPCPGCKGRGVYNLTAEEAGVIDQVLGVVPVRSCPICFGSGEVSNSALRLRYGAAAG